MGTLKIKSVGQVKEAKDTRKYFPVEFSAGFGQRSVSRNLWEEFKNDKNGLPTTDKVWRRGNYQEAIAAMESGAEISGDIVTRKVEKYSLGDRTIETYTTVVFSDEKVENVFAQANHPILDEATRELIGKKDPKKVILATDEAKEKVGTGVTA